MNVREKTVKVEVERRIYISDDGQEFETADDCLRHERNRAEQNAWAIVDKLPHFSYSPDWIDCDYGWDWYYVSTDEELDAVREVLFNDDSSAYEYTPPATRAGSAAPTTATVTGASKGLLSRCSTPWMNSRRALPTR